MDNNINYFFFIVNLAINIFILSFIVPYILNFVAFFCSKTIAKTLNSISKSLKKFNMLVITSIIKIFKSMISLTKVKYVIINPDDLKKYIMKLSPEEFETFCANIYKKLGYNATVTNFKHDGGKDIILTDKRNVVTYIECKKWNLDGGHGIGREICQKLIGSCACDSVKNALIITTGNIHENALEYQNKLNKNNQFNLEIIDFEGLIELYIKAHEPSENKIQIYSKNSF